MTAYDVPRTKWAAELRTLLQGDLTSVALSISTGPSRLLLYSQESHPH